jgi:hypothetical protein
VIFSLSHHANYRCRHAGACCTAGWNIPVDRSRQNAIGVAVLVPGSDGACTYYDRASGLCRIHRDHGPAVLPVSCQQFPRLSLLDRRGTFITLSHFCPTAAAALDSDVPLTIVAAPPAFAPDAHYDGLDAREAWPPLLRPDAMFDLNSYSGWEAWMVTTLDQASTADGALGRIAATAARLRQWRGDHGSFAEWTNEVLATPAAASDDSPRYAALCETEALRTIAGFGHGAPAAIFDEGEPRRAMASAWRDALSAECERIVCRYLASKAFASWSAYQGRGVRTLVAELYATLTVVRGHLMTLREQPRPKPERELVLEAIRRADLLLVHGIERERFTKWLGMVERT